jgi:hypothetical protein
MGRIAEDSGGRKRTYYRYDPVERFCHPFASFEFTEGMSLALEKGGNRLERVTILELLDERVFSQCYASLFFISL